MKMRSDFLIWAPGEGETLGPGGLHPQHHLLSHHACLPRTWPPPGWQEPGSRRRAGLVLRLEAGSGPAGSLLGHKSLHWYLCCRPGSVHPCVLNYDLTQKGR